MPSLDEQDAHWSRLETKLDTVLSAQGDARIMMSDLVGRVERLSDRIEAQDRESRTAVDSVRSEARVAIESMRADILRVEKDWKEAAIRETKERDKADFSLRSTMTRVGMALFTGLIASFGGVVTYIVTTHHP